VRGSAWPCPRTYFTSCATRWRIACSATLGLTVIQSSPGGSSTLPLVSMASWNPTACRAPISSPSSCSAGSPPVRISQSQDTESCRASATISGAVSQRPDANSVSQSKPCVSTRHSWLQRAKRRNTFGVPARTPSPCKL